MHSLPTKNYEQNFEVVGQNGIGLHVQFWNSKVQIELFANAPFEAQVELTSLWPGYVEVHKQAECFWQAHCPVNG